MNAYLWHIDGDLRHHLRAESLDEARERIAVTHGDQAARHAVIKSLQTRRADDKSRSAAA